jgi:integrase
LVLWVSHTRQLLSVEEVGPLLEAASGIKYEAILGTAYGAGPRVSGVASLKVDDINRTRMLIWVEQGKGRKDRNAILSPQHLTLSRLWWKEGKRRGVMLPHGWQFPGRGATDPISNPADQPRGHEAAEAAGIRKRVWCGPIHCANASRPPPGTGSRYPRHPSPAGARPGSIRPRSTRVPRLKRSAR